MARLSERELIQLRKQLIVVRSDLNRQLLATQLSHLGESLAWVPAVMNAAKLAAPVLAVAAPLVLGRPKRGLSWKTLISSGLLCWRLGRKVRSLLKPAPSKANS